MFLLDTVVLSELRKRDRNPSLVTWIAGQKAADLFVSVITIGEIQRGIELQRPKDAVFAETLARWLDIILTAYDDRILDLDRDTTRRWGRLCAELGHDGADLMIAATALEHGLTVVTRNVRHFERADVSICNPFK